ncbi:MAG: methyltransferase domain-containing protein [Verrucomicrobiae bacterium]|nr:methyltransferase domain-containing protein [Verrucomicrobiae bacterium]
MGTAYSPSFFQNRDDALRSARAAVPAILECVRPASVVDVGCGVGSWLKAFQENGVGDFLGIDGDYVDPDWLAIPREKFQAADLSKPLPLPRAFDLVLSLEVAEHLPTSAADTFVDSLVGLGPVILFSAAIPLQGGNAHVNEQWQDYWAAKFEGRGYVVVDALREKLWSQSEVNYFYAQNALFYVRSERLKDYPVLSAAREKTRRSQLNVVHPKQFLASARPLAKIVSMVPGPLRRIGRKIFA